jgi:cytochrome c-type biogenesis protein CcmF
MIGSIFLSIAFAMALISCVSYALSMRVGDRTKYLRTARMGFHGAVIAFMLTCATLMYFILTYQFQYTYVYEHASHNLSRPLLMASFYAGQEGSFMLWTLLVSLIGVFVLGYAQRVRYESEVMTPYMLVLVCLLLIIVVKSPFMTIYQSFPDQGIPAGWVPPNGKGLNPTLENLWITIHPPILFTGFASMTVPFVFAIAGLLKRDYQRWIAISLPWVLFASMVLGFGIMLGGWWAYETLGWGGFWAWDPVENSSLIPWLACVALVHTMLVQKRTGSVATRPGVADKIGGFVKTNFILAFSAFGLILYSTFLTRSGVLGDTSVHSFVSPGGFVYAILLSIIVIFMGYGAVVLARRWRDLRNVSHSFSLMSRENALGLGSAVLLASATVVLIGTSWPIFMPLFGKPKAAVPTDFYNNLHLPISMVLVLLNGISMRLKWRTTTPAGFYRQIGVALGIAVVGTVALVLLGITDPIYVALGFGSLLAMVVNLQIGSKVVRGNPRFIGAYVSHAGVALLMLGIIFTARYSDTRHVRLVQDKPTNVKFANGSEYTLTYKGPEQIEREKTDREKYRHRVVLQRDGATYEAFPVTFMSDYNNRESPFIEPGILYTATKDIYLSPKALDEEGGDPVVTLKKGGKTKVPFDSSLTLRFEKFDMSRAQTEGKQGGVMEITSGDSSFYLTAYRNLSDGSYSPVPIPGTDITVGMYGLNADRANLSNSEAVLRFSSKSHPQPPPKQTITLDVSIKPFISFVWAGVVIMVGGFFFSILRRRREIEPLVPSEGSGIAVAGTPVQATRQVSEGVVARTGRRD